MLPYLTYEIGVEAKVSNSVPCGHENATKEKKEGTRGATVLIRVTEKFQISNCLLFSSMGLGFLNPSSQLKQANVAAFCMQLGNSEDR